MSDHEQFVLHVGRGEKLKFSRGAFEPDGQLDGVLEHDARVRSEAHRRPCAEESVHRWASARLHDAAKQLQFAHKERNYLECTTEAGRLNPEILTLCVADILSDGDPLADFVVREIGR